MSFVDLVYTSKLLSFSLASLIPWHSMIPHLVTRELYKALSYIFHARIQKQRNNALTSCHNSLCVQSRAFCYLQPLLPKSCAKILLCVNKTLKKWNLEFASPSGDYLNFLCFLLSFLIVNPLILQNTFWCYKILVSFRTIL